MKPTLQTISTALIGLLVLGLLLFLPAWTFYYWQAWVFIIVFSVTTNAIGIYLSLKNPALLQRRMKVGPAAETRLAQKIAISIGFLALIGVLVFSALDHRFGWSLVPTYVTLLGDVLVALGLFIDLLVFRENSFGGSSIETVGGQQVITTGPYSLMRHPMYVGVLVMIVGIPLALGSWWGLGVILLAVPVLILRILDEEEMLKHELTGYPGYMQQVRYRLIPYVW